MKITTKFLKLIILTMTISLTSCVKEGPQGEPGIQGIAGQDGLNATDGTNGNNGVDGTHGVDGTNGVDGNANVIASPWIPEEFINVPSSDTEFSIMDPNITSEISSSAAILVYGRSAFGPVVGIPITIANSSYFFYINPALNNITFAAESIDGSHRIYDVFEHFRYVIIPANTTSKIDYPNFSKMTYEEVMDHFKLEY